jgi:hypothetical protein
MDHVRKYYSNDKNLYFDTAAYPFICGNLACSSQATRSLNLFRSVHHTQPTKLVRTKNKYFYGLSVSLWLILCAFCFVP